MQSKYKTWIPKILYQYWDWRLRALLLTKINNDRFKDLRERYAKSKLIKKQLDPRREAPTFDSKQLVNELQRLLNPYYYWSYKSKISRQSLGSHEQSLKPKPIFKQFKCKYWARDEHSTQLHDLTIAKIN